MSHNDSEANWNRQADRPDDGQDHVLSQADALTKKTRLAELGELGIYPLSVYFFCHNA